MKVNFITEQADKRLIYILKQFLDFSALDIEIAVRKPSSLNRTQKNIYYLADFHQIPQGEGIFIYCSPNYKISALRRLNYNYEGRDFFVWEEFLKEAPPIKKDKDRVYINFDFFSQAFYQLSCCQEYNLEGNGRRLCSKVRGITQDTDAFKTPNVNILFLLLEKLIGEMLATGEARHERYPAGKKFAVVLTHDIDAVRKSMKQRVKFVWHGINKIARLTQAKKFAKAWGELSGIFPKFFRCPEYNNIDYLAAMEEKNGVRSSFNVYTRNGRDKPGLVKWFYNPEYDILKETVLVRQLKELLDEEFEVGIHGSYFSGYNNSLLKQEIKTLEDVFKRKIQGGRQHFLNYSVSRTPGVFQNAALDYDTSMGFRDISGFRSGACFPYYLYSLAEDNETGVLEIPLAIMDGVLFDRQDGTKESAWSSAAGILEKIKDAEGCASVIWHQHAFNNRDFPFWEEVYSMLISWVKDNQGALLRPGELNNFWRSKRKDKLTLQD